MLKEKEMHIFGGALSLVNKISEITLRLLPLVGFIQIVKILCALLPTRKSNWPIRNSCLYILVVFT